MSQKKTKLLARLAAMKGSRTRPALRYYGTLNHRARGNFTKFVEMSIYQLLKQAEEANAERQPD